jgi:hypothetical protein
VQHFLSLQVVFNELNPTMVALPHNIFFPVEFCELSSDWFTPRARFESVFCVAFPTAVSVPAGFG